MKLPNRDQAYIDPRKLTDYLLSDTHPIGKSKASFFHVIGYDKADAESLAQVLLSIASLEDIKDVSESPHGTKFVLEGLLGTPSGRTVRLTTIWMIDAGQDRPRFITAYPA